MGSVGLIVVLCPRPHRALSLCINDHLAGVRRRRDWSAPVQMLLTFDDFPGRGYICTCGSAYTLAMRTGTHPNHRSMIDVHLAFRRSLALCCAPGPDSCIQLQIDASLESCLSVLWTLLEPLNNTRNRIWNQYPLVLAVDLETSSQQVVTCLLTLRMKIVATCRVGYLNDLNDESRVGHRRYIGAPIYRHPTANAISSRRPQQVLRLRAVDVV